MLILSCITLAVTAIALQGGPAGIYTQIKISLAFTDYSWYLVWKFLLDQCFRNKENNKQRSDNLLVITINQSINKNN